MFTIPFAFLNQNVPPVINFLLDDYPGATWACSLRKLSSSYTGYCIKVRRSSDNTEQDIGFVGEDLDTSALSSFCSGTDGFITTWYDQSGNSRNATQTTNANQPRIVLSGVIDTVSGIGSSTPAIKFDGSTDFLQFGSGLVSSFTQATAYTVAKTVSIGGGWWAFNDDGGGAAHHPWTDGNGYENFGNNSRPGFSSAGKFVSQHLYTVMSKTNDFQVFTNGASMYSNATNTVVFSTGNVRLGTNFSANTYFYNGYFQEHILYPSDNLTDRSGIESNINAYFSVY